MSVEERLHSLAAQVRQQHGDAFLCTPAQFVPRLTSQAPDLYGEARALAAALAMNAAGSIAAAPDPEAEATRVAADIAGRERLSMAVATPAVAVARRLGPLRAAAMPSAPAASEWAGDSVIAAPPPPTYHAAPPAAPHHPVPPSTAHAPQPVTGPEEHQRAGAAEPIWKNRWALAAAGAVGLLVLYQVGSKQQQGQQVPPMAAPPQQGPGVQGQPMQPGQAPPPAGQQPNTGPVPSMPQPGPQQGPQQAGLPLLQPPGGNLPALAVQQGPGGAPVIFFQVQTRGGPVPAMVGLPAGGWDSGPAMFGFTRQGNSGGQPDTMGMAPFRSVNGQSGPVRTATPNWQQDNIGVGDICVAFMGSQPAPDVVLRGATMCVMDASCGQAAGCGRMP